MSVVIETTLGDITVDLYLQERPRACLNFLKLCKIKYYNYNLFHTVSRGFITQTGDPTGSRTGGESIFGVIEGPAKRYVEAEANPRIKHTKMGLISFVCNEDFMMASQFFFTLADELTYLDEKHCVFGEIVEGHDVLEQINEAICCTEERPYQDIRITHTVVLDDPLPDPPNIIVPPRSPSPSADRLQGGRIPADEEIDETTGKSAKEIGELVAEREAKARATILEMVGDIPDAEMAPPENVLFVCKLNPVTTDDDLEIIFSRFGKIKTCEVIRDHKTGDSLQYAFIEFEEKKSCEEAYFKMDNVLIDDRRIHVDFSQSVSKIRWNGKGRGVTHFDSKGKKITNQETNQRTNGGNGFKKSRYDDNTDKYPERSRKETRRSRERSESPHRTRRDGNFSANNKQSNPRSNFNKQHRDSREKRNENNQHNSSPRPRRDDNERRREQSLSNSKYDEHQTRNRSRSPRNRDNIKTYNHSASNKDYERYSKERNIDDKKYKGVDKYELEKRKEYSSKSTNCDRHGKLSSKESGKYSKERNLYEKEPYGKTHRGDYSRERDPPNRRHDERKREKNSRDERYREDRHEVRQEHKVYNETKRERSRKGEEEYDKRKHYKHCKHSLKHRKDILPSNRKRKTKNSDLSSESGSGHRKYHDALRRDRDKHVKSKKKACSKHYKRDTSSSDSSSDSSDSEYEHTKKHSRKNKYTYDDDKGTVNKRSKKESRKKDSSSDDSDSSSDSESESSDSDSDHEHKRKKTCKKVSRTSKNKKTHR